MKLTKNQKIRLALFWIIAGGLTIGVFGFLVGGRILERRDIYYVEYYNQPVSGLQVGGAVRYQGVQVGRVDKISFDPDEPSRVIVVLSLREGTPIKADVEAQLAMAGITGGRHIELIGGSRHTDTLPPGSEISSGTTIFDDITGDTQMIISKVEIMLNNVNALLDAGNQQRFRRILANVDTILEESRDPFIVSVAKLDAVLDNIDRTAQAAGDVTEKAVDIAEKIAETTEKLTELMERVAVITDKTASITERDDFETTIDTLVESIGDINHAIKRIKELADAPEWEAIIQNADNITADLSLVQLAEMSNEVSLLLEQFGQSFTRMDMTIIRSSRDIIRSMEIMYEILEDLNEFSRRISEDPSSLIQF